MIRILFLLSILLCFSDITNGCSFIKITKNGKTVVGNNEDFHFPNVKMGIEPATDGKYGVIYFGNNDHAIGNTKNSPFNPQGGINEAGLVFDYLSVSSIDCNDSVEKPAIPDYLSFLKKDIMQNCANVYEVKKAYEKYDICWNHLTVFVDRNGDYLFLDNGRLLIGNDEYLVQTNFHPWEIPNCKRYDTAQTFLNKNFDNPIKHCTKIMEAMHMEYTMGGTQYTNVYDLDNGLIYLYYYHDFDEVEIINIKDELKKGEERVVFIPDLFPNNKKGWENVNAFNHHKETIEQLTDSILLADSSSFTVLLDSIKLISKDKRFKHNYYNGMRIMSLYICETGNYWYYKKNFSNAMICYNVAKKFYPNSWGSYNNIGFLHYEEEEYELALDNFVIRYGLEDRNIILKYIDSCKWKLPAVNTTVLNMWNGYYYAGPKYSLIIENNDDSVKIFSVNKNNHVRLLEGKPVSDKHFLMDEESIVFFDKEDSHYHFLKYYVSSDKRGYKYKRADFHLSNQQKKSCIGTYVSNNMTIDISFDLNNYLTMKINKYGKEVETIVAYPSSTSNFIYKFGRLNFLEKTNDLYNKIQVYIDNQSIECERILN